MAALGEFRNFGISREGPGKYFTSEAEAAKKRNIKLYTMNNTGGLTWDFGKILDQLIKIIEAEMENVKSTIPITERDSAGNPAWNT